MENTKIITKTKIMNLEIINFVHLRFFICSLIRDLCVNHLLLNKVKIK